MKARRIEFEGADAARFNKLRDDWRGAAAGLPLSASARRVAMVLPTFVNREFGYAFPTDDDLRGALNASRETIKRGLKDLEDAGLIERLTRPKRDENREAIGRERRVFLTLPYAKGSTKDVSEVKGQKVKGQPDVKGQKRGGEGSYGGPNIPDRNTPDISGSDRKVSSYAHTPARNPYPTPPSWGEDQTFLDVFDRTVASLTFGNEIAAEELEQITAKAFDETTDSRDDFMPVHWRDVLALRSGSMADWFRFRASSLAMGRAAA